jgi:Protein of unknown function (DUF2911)
MRIISICAILVAGLITLASAQQPALTQSAIKMSGKGVALSYSAPSLQGRKIFGGVVPYNQVWLAGDGAAVTFRTDVPLEVQGLAVPKGEYTLYVLPDAKEWQLIINKQIGPQALKYNQKLDLGRVPMDMKKAGAPVETLKMTLTSLGSVAGKLEMAWENTIASVPFNIDSVKASAEW